MSDCFELTEAEQIEGWRLYCLRMQTPTDEGYASWVNSMTDLGKLDAAKRHDALFCERYYKENPGPPPPSDDPQVQASVDAIRRKFAKQ